MAIVEKPNHTLRICLDSQPLNLALNRERYKLPILDDILPQLHQAKLFSKVDVKQTF